MIMADPLFRERSRPFARFLGKRVEPETVNAFCEFVCGQVISSAALRRCKNSVTL
jgi:hypothetical protein